MTVFDALVISWLILACKGACSVFSASSGHTKMFPSGVQTMHAVRSRFCMKAPGDFALRSKRADKAACLPAKQLQTRWHAVQHMAGSQLLTLARVQMTITETLSWQASSKHHHRRRNLPCRAWHCIVVLLWADRMFSRHSSQQLLPQLYIATTAASIVRNHSRHVRSAPSVEVTERAGHEFASRKRNWLEALGMNSSNLQSLVTFKFAAHV